MEGEPFEESGTDRDGLSGQSERALSAQRVAAPSQDGWSQTDRLTDTGDLEVSRDAQRSAVTARLICHKLPKSSRTLKYKL